MPLLRRISTTGLALVLLLGLGACRDGQEAEAETAAPPPAVTVAPVTLREVRPSFQFIGRVGAIETVDLRAKVVGDLLSILVEEGANVEVGDLLFEIDDERYRAAEALAQAEVDRAQATVTETEAALARARTLSERGNVSEAQVDEAQAAFDRARADLAARQAQLHSARIDLGDTRILAPIAGRIGEAALSVGNLVGPETGPLARITALDPAYVHFPISERDLVAARQEAAAAGGAPDLSTIDLTLTLPGGGAYAYTGRVDFVGTEVDPTTGTVPLRGVFDNPDDLLVPGQFVTVSLSQGAPQPVLVVPQAAIQEDQSGKFVLTVDQANMVAVAPITVGQQLETDWVVTGGLDESQRVIVQGLQKVRPGMTVAPTVAAAPGS